MSRYILLLGEIIPPTHFNSRIQSGAQYLRIMIFNLIWRCIRDVSNLLGRFLSQRNRWIIREWFVANRFRCVLIQVILNESWLFVGRIHNFLRSYQMLKVALFKTWQALLMNLYRCSSLNRWFKLYDFIELAMVGRRSFGLFCQFLWGICFFIVLMNNWTINITCTFQLAHTGVQDTV